MIAQFYRLVLSALCGGLLSGALLAAAHLLTTAPLIAQAEAYEKAQPAHDHAAYVAEGGWRPETGIERAVYTVAADLMAAIGFALLVAAGLCLAGGGWRQGLWWGLAGFAAIIVAPGLGLPPVLPGAGEAPLLARQLWWLLTATATGGGLALLAFTKHVRWAVLAIVLIALPQFYGAPQPAEHTAAAPEALARQFAAMATAVNFLFWAALGASTGYFYRRFAT